MMHYGWHGGEKIRAITRVARFRYKQGSGNIMTVVGLDIGGANIKASDGEQHAVNRPFDIWKAPHQLCDELRLVLAEFRDPQLLAVTMTAELADCFRTKAEGVDFILTAVEQAGQGLPILVWQTGAEFVEPDVAREIPLLVGAANWHALATFAGRLVPEGHAILVDIGSTTTDIIPIQDGVPIAEGMTDLERILAGELVYAGVRRTPVCAITQTVPLRDQQCPLAAEFFASTLDVYLLLGELAECAQDTQTCNGRPATRAEASDRLARAVCCDVSELSPDEIEGIARAITDALESRLMTQIERVLGRDGQRCENVLISGAGSFLAERVVARCESTRDANVVLLDKLLSGPASTAACAYAVSRLAAERVRFHS